MKKVLFKMKRVLLPLLAIIVAMQTPAFADVADIPETQAVSLPGGHIKVISEDFDENYTASRWANITTEKTSSGNTVGKVPPATTATYGVGQVYLGGFTIQANIKLDYVIGKWTEIMDIGYTSEDKKGKIMAVKNADGSAKLYFATVGQTTNCWDSFDITGHQIFDGEWVKLKVELEGETVNIYLDDVLAITNSKAYTLPNAALGFKTFADGSTIYIDNLLVSKFSTDTPDEIPASEKNPDRYTILYQDFENMTQGTQEEIEQMGYDEIYSFAGSLKEGFGGQGNAFDFKGDYINKSLNLGKNFTIEMNVKIDPKVNGEYGKSWPEIKFNYSKSTQEYCYKFYFNTDSSKAFPSFTKPLGSTTGWPSLSGNRDIPIADFDSEWAYIKLEREDNIIRFYWNNKETPICYWTDNNTTELNGGGLRINSSTGAYMIIDNLYISTPDFPASKFTTSVSLSAVKDTDKDISVINADVSAVNNTDAQVYAGTAIIAAYSGNMLVGVNTVDIGTLGANPKNGTEYTPKTVQTSFNVPGDSGNYNYKMFIWDMATLEPKCSAKDIPSI